MSEPIVISLIAAIAPTLAVIGTWLVQRKKLGEIHVLVNSRLTEALQQIEKLKKEIKGIYELDSEGP